MCVHVCTLRILKHELSYTRKSFLLLSFFYLEKKLYIEIVIISYVIECCNISIFFSQTYKILIGMSKMSDTV